MCGHVYANPERVASKLGTTILQESANRELLAKRVTQHPEQFGELRGRSGLLGDNRDRKLARHQARALAHHIASIGQRWERWLEAERSLETWKREKRDVIEVPGLTKRSEAILREFDALPHAERPQFLARLSGSAAGRQAFNEATQVAQALERRFGSSDSRDLTTDNLRLGAKATIEIERIRAIARITDRAQRAELSRQHQMKRSLDRGLRQ